MKTLFCLYLGYLAVDDEKKKSTHPLLVTKCRGNVGKDEPFFLHMELLMRAVDAGCRMRWIFFWAQEARRFLCI